MDFENNLLAKKSRGSGFYGVLLNVVLVLVILALLAVLIVTASFSLCEVDGTSMLPGLVDDQYVLVEKHKAEIKKGDVIVFKKNGTQYIKRALAVGGDKFGFRRTADGRAELYVNGELKEENYINGRMYAEYWGKSYLLDGTYCEVLFKLGEEYTVPDGEILALGDNRNISMDSRVIGFVTRDELIGRVDAELEPGSFPEWLIKLIYGVYFRPQTGSAGQVSTI